MQTATGLQQGSVTNDSFWYCQETFQDIACSTTRHGWPVQLFSNLQISLRVRHTTIFASLQHLVALPITGRLIVSHPGSARSLRATRQQKRHWHNQLASLQYLRNYVT